MRILTFAALAATLCFAACSDRETGSGLDPSVDNGGNGGSPDGGGDEGGSPDGTSNPDINLPDVPAASGTVEALQTASAAVPCENGPFQSIQQNAALDAVVVASPKFDAFTADEGGTSLDGYYVQDPGGGAWRGIQITVDREEGTNFVPGDTLKLTGELQERYCNSQLKVDTYELGTPTDAPQPTVVDPAELGNEQWEGVLVKVEGVEVLSEEQGGVYKITGDTIVSYQFDFFLSLEVGKTYDLTGVMRYAFDEFQLIPRTEDDVVVKGSGPDPDPTGSSIVELQQGDASANCTNESIQNLTQGIEIEGVVVVPQFSVSSNLHGYYLATESTEPAAPWSGIRVVVDKSENTSWAIGDHVKVVGEHVEFYCDTQLSVDTFEVLGTKPEPPAHVFADIYELIDAVESYEGVLVTVPNVSVTDNAEWDDKGFVTVSGGFFMDRSIIGQDLPKPEVGQTWTSITGVVRYSFGTHRLVPRSLDELVEGSGPGPEPEPEPQPEPAPEAAPDAGGDASTDAGPDAQ